MFNILKKHEDKYCELKGQLKSLENITHSVSKFAYRHEDNIIAKGYTDTQGIVVEELEEYQIINHSMEANYSTPHHYHPTNRQYMILLTGEFWVEVDDKEMCIDGDERWCLSIPPMTKHRIFTKNKRAQLLVINIPPLEELS